MSGSHRFPLGLLRDAAELIDASGFATNITAWMREDSKYRGGRATSLSTRSVLIAWLALAMEESPLHMSRVAEVLTVRLTPEGADILGVPHEFADIDVTDMVQRVKRATDRFMEALDYKPLPTRQRRLLKSEWEENCRTRDEEWDVNEKKRLRLFRISNDILHTQNLSLPESVRTEKVSVSIDATFLSSFGRGAGPTNLANRAAGDRYISEPDAALYIRTYEQNDGTSVLKKRGFGWEYELAAIISNDPTQPRAVPHIVIGFNQHPASTDSNPRAREIFDDLKNRGLILDHVVGDQAYFPGATEDMLQNPLRGGGAKLVMKYAKSQDKREANGEGTIQGRAHGAIQVEGKWYCPAFPAELRNAAVTYQKALKADRENKSLTHDQRAQRAAQHKARLDAHIIERRRWELTAKEQPDERGRYPMTCPAVGSGRTLSCRLKPAQTAKLPKGVVPLPLTPADVPKAQGAICKNKSSVSFHIDDDGKYGQYYRYLSPEWQRAHSHGRQVIESFNQSLKRGDNVVRDSGTRRRRGEAAQTFLALIAVVATNARRIRLWMEEHYDEHTPAPEAVNRMSRTPRPLAPRRTSRRGSKGLSAARAAQLGLPTPARAHVPA